LFSDFRFKSFRQHKLIEEDYELLKTEEPEELPKIKLDAYMTKQKVEKEAIELC
jgi:hypothetical protein